MMILLFKLSLTFFVISLVSAGVAYLLDEVEFESQAELTEKISDIAKIVCICSLLLCFTLGIIWFVTLIWVL